MDRPIPSFYCVYLLRSLAQPRAAPYVGSTPNPRRRLREHNGLSKGRGASRTSAQAKRPWHMALIVTGFPSRIAALQFEWSWQKTHLTRHIPKDERLFKNKATSLKDYLRNLRLLLSVASFRHWPLNVSFYCKKAYNTWQETREPNLEALRPNIDIRLDESASGDKCESLLAKSAAGEDGHVMQRFEDLPAVQSLYALDVTYGSIMPHAEHSLSLLAEAEPLHCYICRQALDAALDKIVICPEGECKMSSHVSCLSSHFLKSSKSDDALLPVHGKCPNCKRGLSWSELVKDLSLRLRGSTEIARQRRRRKVSKTKTVNTISSNMATDSIRDRNGASKDSFVSIDEIEGLSNDYDDEGNEDDDDEYDASFAQTFVDEHSGHTDGEYSENEPPPLPVIHEKALDSSSDLQKSRRRSGMVVPDSEWDDVEEIT